MRVVRQAKTGGLALGATALTDVQKTRFEGS